VAVPTRISDLSATAASNSPAGSDTVGTTWDDYLRAGFSIVRGDLATKGADIASASTTDLGAIQGLAHDITGTTTITSFGTVAAGIWKIVKYEGALTITHNATSLILLGAENRTTADGDTQILISEGSGNWREVAYFPVTINPGKHVSTDESQTLTNKTLTAAVLGGTTDVSGGQLKFPAAQSASADANTLDDYEEGSWTPSIGGTATYSFQVGRYTKIGNMVAIQMDLQITAIGTGSTTAITGLPFAPALNASLAVSNFASSATNITALMARIVATGTTIDLLSTTAAQASVASNAIFGNSARVMLSGIYFI
jgi:hypothetical protein